MKVQTQGNCPTVILAWPTQIISNTPSPAVLLLDSQQKKKEK
jgi:hypothetical protein